MLGLIFDFLVIFLKASFFWIGYSSATYNDKLFLVLQPKAYRLLPRWNRMANGKIMFGQE